MFRSQPNAFDELVAKATDENLTTEPWGEIMNVVDKVSDTDSGAKDAVAALIKRLNHRNANVQLYALELANALSQNCGIKLHRELASRSFTDALLRLANERNTHQKVKAKILERMADWAEMFGRNPELGIMEQAYMKLKTQNPHLQPPSQPPKTLITDQDRRREEEELQMALALSIKEKDKLPNSSSNAQQQQNTGTAQSAQSSQINQQQSQPTGNTAATVSRVRALYDFTPTEAGELQFRKGDIISVVESVYKDWWRGSLHGQTGIFPLNYVEKLQDPTREELEREAHMEAEVFAEIKNVEKLLALLSTSAESGGGRAGDVRDNEEITGLYHSTVAIRPKLIELIGKYSQKKDDFTQLNEKFIKARRDYEALLEASMSQPQGYGRPAYSSYPSNAYSGGPGGYAGPQSQAQNPNSYYQSGPPPQDSYASQQQQQQQQQQPLQSQQGSNGPQPFYFIPPNQAGGSQVGGPPPQQGGQGGYTPQQHDNASSDDLYAPPNAQSRISLAQRPHSMAFDPRVQQQQHQGLAPQGQGGAGPSELASVSYDSPTSGLTGAAPSGPGGRPSSPYGANTGKPQDGGYGAQAGGRVPSDPYSWSATGNGMGRPPAGDSSPTQAQHHGGYPPQTAGYPPQSAAGYPPQSVGYSGYSGYKPAAG